MKKRFGMAVLVMGFSGLVAQMLLLRELLVVFSGNELSIGIILANWLILEACGSFCLGKAAEKPANRVEKFAAIAIIFSLCLPVSLYFTRILKNILGASIGEPIGLLTMLYSSFLILLPASLTHGALFTFGCKIHSGYSGKGASSIGSVYIYETLGTIAGGIAWTYLLIPYMNAFQMATGIAALNFLVCAFLLAPHRKTGTCPQKALAAVSIVFLLLAVHSIMSGSVDRLHRFSIDAQWRRQNVVHYRNSIYGNICVIESGGQYTFFTDGIPYIATPVPDMLFVEEFVHLPLLAHPAPENVMVLSGGAGGVIHEILKHPVATVEYAELDPLLVDILQEFPTPMTQAELKDARVTVRHVDGRLFLRTTEGRYDMIFIGITEPADLQSNRFFTKEFFSLACEKLHPGGILVIALPGSLAYLNEELRDLNACIFNTLKEVFAYVRALPGDGVNIFMSSDASGIARLENTMLAERLGARRIETDLVAPWHIEQRLHPRWEEWFASFIQEGSTKINRDFRPVGMYYSISHWNALLNPRLRPLFRQFEKVRVEMFFIIFMVLTGAFFTFKKRKVAIFGSGIPLCTATTGFAGMMFDLALIFTFQAIYGYVFAWIGLLVTSFMAGAASGAMTANRFLARIKQDFKVLIAVEISIICFAAGLPLIFTLLQPHLNSPALLGSLRILFLLLSFAAGFLTGIQFPVAGNIYLGSNKNLSRTAGLLYGADLLGGWIGGIAGGVILLPVLGLFGACMVVVFLKMFSLAAVAWSPLNA